ncbi:MAG: GAF domain-containing protein [Deltaproteobacteria bacterium]|nr:GAF domain-containing protein [Deltaproteobacteria bacterium]
MASLISGVIAPFSSYFFFRLLYNYDLKDKALQKRLSYEKMLNSISELAISATDMHKFQEKCLEIMGRALDVSRVYLFKHQHKTDTIDNSFEWCAPDRRSQKDELQGSPSSVIPWWMSTLKTGRIIKYRDIEDIPGEQEKDMLRRKKVKSILVVPLYIQDEYFGFMGFDECRTQREWMDEDVEIIKTISQIIHSTLERNKSEKALKRRMVLERFIREISSRFVRMRPEEVDEVIEETLASIGTFLGADRASVYLFKKAIDPPDDTYVWYDEEVKALKEAHKDIPIS